MRTRIVLTLLVISVAGALAAWPASAQHGHVRERVHAGDVEPLDRILPDIRRQHPGTFYDAEGPVMDEGGRYHYRLKWMNPNGRIIWLDTDARTGRVLGVEGGQERPYGDSWRGRGAAGENLPRRGNRPGMRFDGGWNGGIPPPPGYRGGPGEMERGGFGRGDHGGDHGGFNRHGGFGHGDGGGPHRGH